MTTFSDNFDRANETPLSGGGNWVLGGGAGEASFNLATNSVTPSNTGLDCSMIYVGSTPVTWANDQSSKANLTSPNSLGGGQGIGLWVRHIGASAKTGYRFVIDHAGSSNLEIARFNAATYHFIGNATVSWTDGDLFEFAAVGAPGSIVLKVLKNGSQVALFTDTDGTNGVASGAPGIATSSTAGGTVDNWVGTDQFTTSVMGTTPHRMPLAV